MKNTRSDNQNDDNQANRDDAGNEGSGGLFGGLMGAVESTQDMAEATRDAQNRGVGGAADSAVGGITGMAEAAKQQADRQTADNVGIFGDLANSVSDASRDFGAGATGGGYGGSSGGGGDTGRRWDETPEVGVTYDAQGNRVDAGSSGGGGGGLIDSLVGGATGVAEGAEQAVETQQNDGEWTSLSGTEDAVGSESFDERLRRAHEEAGTGWYGGSQTSADDNNNNSGT
jgi:hypothetical protein